MTIKITRLKLENWRNFKKVDLPFQDRMFIVGPNASGKTNLLDAIRFLRDIATPGGGLVNAIHARGGMSHIRSLFARQKPSVAVELSLSVAEVTWTYRLELAGTKNNADSLVRERVLRNGELVLDRPDREDKLDRELLTETHLQSKNKNGGFRDLADALASVQHVHVSPQVTKSGHAEHWTARDAPGSAFIDQMADLPDRTQRAVLGRIERQLKHAVPQFSKLKIQRDNRGRPHLQAKYKHWRPNGGWQNEQDFSDGTLRLIGVLWAIDQGTAPLLLEEPELSLHADVVRQLPRLMYAAASKSGRQFIVNTHSEDMLMDQGVRADEVVILRPTDEETTATLASRIPQLRVANEAGVPLAGLIRGLTRPRGIERLAKAVGS